ncbi:phosphotransferase [Xanthobacter autotrophicus DSM 431]|uniref:phosphotransferase enzyme family protein n=1 Tax=Xanthobacter nonsaccharivorans TaxID=3119912 RepID=UPI003729B643
MLYDETFLSRLENGVRAALPRWGVARDAQVKLLTISENATFRVTDKALGNLVFRVHRPGYHSRAEIASELAWIEALRADAVVTTPRPIPLMDGSLIADIDDDGITRHVVAFEFLPGSEPAEGEDLAAWFRHLGAIHARLHAHARSWTRPEGFTRKVWNFESTLGDKPLWGDFRAALGLDAAGRALLERTAAVLKEKLAPLDRPESFGLVHADLRLANLLVDGERLALIDFDDCGFSWFLYDFAAAISFLEHEPYVPVLKAAWLEGYAAAAPLPADAEAQLDLFVMLRRILLTAWVVSHAETPTAQSMGVSYTQGTLTLAEAFLARHG